MLAWLFLSDLALVLILVPVMSLVGVCACAV